MLALAFGEETRESITACRLVPIRDPVRHLDRGLFPDPDARFHVVWQLAYPFDKAPPVRPFRMGMSEPLC